MNKETIKVVNIGKPDIEAMSGSEQNTFFSELLSKISSLSKQHRAEVSTLYQPNRKPNFLFEKIFLYLTSQTGKFFATLKNFFST